MVLVKLEYGYARTKNPNYYPMPWEFLGFLRTRSRSMTYQDQIKSPKWQKKRLEVLEMNGFKCESCGGIEKQLHVHHAHYKKGNKIWEYDARDLLCLCEDCHAKSHKTQDRILKLIGFIETVSPQMKDQVLGYLEGLTCLPQKGERSNPFMRGYLDACQNMILKPHFELLSKHESRESVTRSEN